MSCSLFNTKVDLLVLSYPITRLDRPSGFQEVEVLRIYRQAAHEGVKFVSPIHRPHLSLRRYPWHSVVLGSELILSYLKKNADNVVHQCSDMNDQLYKD